MPGPWLGLLLLLWHACPLVRTANGPGDAGQICLDGVGWVGQLSSAQPVEWHFLKKNTSAQLEISCLGLRTQSRDCNVTGLEVTLNIDSYPAFYWTLKVGQNATMYKSSWWKGDSQWWLKAKSTNDCPASIILSLTVSQPTWTMCPTTEDGTQCGGHGYCDFTYPLTAPGVCRCHQDDDLGYWNGTVCDDCDRRHHGWRCRLPVRCHTEHGVCEYPLCCGRLGLGRCSACHPGFYGRDCSNPVSCQPTGTCLEGSCYGLNGNGLCDSCDTEHSNVNCSQPVLCDKSRGICLGPDSRNPCWGPNGTGFCSQCKPYFHGAGCTEAAACATQNGHCLEGSGDCYGPNGTGVCSACNHTHYGQYCDRVVQCDRRHGLCDARICSGTAGTGGCTRCKSEVWGGQYCTERLPHPPYAEWILAICLSLSLLTFCGPPVLYALHRETHPPRRRPVAYSSLHYYSSDVLAGGTAPFARVQQTNPAVPTRLYF